MASYRARPSRWEAGRGWPAAGLLRWQEISAAIGVEIGVSRLRMGTVNLLGKLLDTEVVEISSKTTVDDVIHRSVAFYRRQEAKLAAQGTRIVGIGVAVTGLVDTDSGISRFAPNLGWRNVIVKDLLVQQLGSPVIVDNNVRLMALGEEWFGRARNSGHHLGAGGLRCGLRNRPAKLGLCKALSTGQGVWPIVPSCQAARCAAVASGGANPHLRAGHCGHLLAALLSAPNSALPVPQKTLL